MAHVSEERLAENAGDAGPVAPCGRSFVNVAIDGSWAGFEVLAGREDESFSQMRVELWVAILQS